MYRGAKNNDMALGICSRSNDVVEPMIKPQWWVSCKSLGMEALNAAMDGENRKLEFIPKQYTADWRRYSCHVIGNCCMSDFLQFPCNIIHSVEISGLIEKP